MGLKLSAATVMRAKPNQKREHHLEATVLKTKFVVGAEAVDNGSCRM